MDDLISGPTGSKASVGNAQTKALHSSRNSSIKIGGALENFEDLIAQVDRNQPLYRHDKEVSLVAWKDDLGRFRVWAASVGAFEPGEAALDLRLSHCSSRVNQEIADLLEELRGVIEEARRVVAEGRAKDHTRSVQSQEPVTEDSRSELQSLYGEVLSIIRCLNRMSGFVNDSAPSNVIVNPASLTLESGLLDILDDSILDMEDSFENENTSPAATSGTTDTILSEKQNVSVLARESNAESAADASLPQSGTQMSRLHSHGIRPQPYVSFRPSTLSREPEWDFPNMGSVLLSVTPYSSIGTSGPVHHHLPDLRIDDSDPEKVTTPISATSSRWPNDYSPDRVEAPLAEGEVLYTAFGMSHVVYPPSTATAAPTSVPMVDISEAKSLTTDKDAGSHDSPGSKTTQNPGRMDPPSRRSVKRFPGTSADFNTMDRPRGSAGGTNQDSSADESTCLSRRYLTSESEDEGVSARKRRHLGHDTSDSEPLDDPMHGT